MYNTEGKATTDSKYLAADILSSMAHGESNTPYSIGYTSGLQSLTTPTLTPTTLSNIEQTFLELQTVPMTVTSSGQPRYTQSGFVPPIIDPVHSDAYGYESSECEGDWSPSSSTSEGNRRRGNKNMSVPYSVLARKYPSMRRRDLKNEMVAPDEQERRKVRRERNALAAAKCRQRRVDVQNVLQAETDTLENERCSLETEIQTLQQTKEQLEFLLEAHKNVCKKDGAHHGNNKTSVIVKHESSTDSFRRPNTLPIPTTTSAIGVSICTPSQGVMNTPSAVFNFGFDSMVDGSTGLTPITGVPSCSKQHRHSSESSPDALSPKLISL